MQNSCLEGSIFDQLFQDLEGHGLSAMQALNGANREQIPIQLTTAGKIALAPQREITHGNWRSSGYIL
jgi:hypothetical protein